MVLKLGSVCAMLDCKNYSIQKNARTFHRFPRDKKLCAEWIQKCRRLDLEKLFNKTGVEAFNRSYRVCSDHFRLSDYNNPNMRSQGLKSGTLPTANLPVKSFSPVKGKKSKRQALPGLAGVTQLVEESVSRLGDPEYRERLLENSMDFMPPVVPSQKEIKERKLKTYERIPRHLRQSSDLDKHTLNEPVFKFTDSLQDYSVYRVIPVGPVINIQSSSRTVSTMTDISKAKFNQMFNENKELRKRIADLEEQLSVFTGRPRLVRSEESPVLSSK